MEEENPWIPGAMLAPWIILAGAIFPLSPALAVGIVITGVTIWSGWGYGFFF